jgi:hypothetical protein
MILANELLRFSFFRNVGVIMHLKVPDLESAIPNELFELNVDEMESVAGGPEVANDPGQG